MRTTFPIAAAVAIAAVASPAALPQTLATAAAVLLEAAPLVLVSAALARARLPPWLAAYAGCGCGGGPSARSLPAALATAALFGPGIAGARLLAGTAVARIADQSCSATASSPLDGLAEMVPAALLCAAVAQLAPRFGLAHAPPVAAALAGALLGFVSPCGLGSAAVAGALRGQSPIAAAVFLCVAGIADLRVFMRPAHTAARHDAFAYALAGAACAAAALHRGAGLLGPYTAAATAIAAPALLMLAVRHRKATAPRVRTAPVLALAGALIAVPPPSYAATGTTIDGLFPGESLSFTGALVRDADGDALVRYAILCCRADASPMVLHLTGLANGTPGSWYGARGTIVERNGRFALRAQRIEPAPTPADPFVYR